MFFLDMKLLESFPNELIEELLNRKVYSVMLSLPTVRATNSDDAVTEDEHPPDPLEYLGLVEQKLSTILYGNGNPLSPSPGS